MSNELDEDDFLEPCSGKPKVEGHGQYGLCQAGTSLAVSDVSKQFPFILKITTGLLVYNGENVIHVIKEEEVARIEILAQSFFAKKGNDTFFCLQDGDVLIGTPGPYNWRGSVFKNIIRESLTETRKWYQSPVEDPLDEDDRPKPATGYYSYLGTETMLQNLRITHL